MVKATAMTDLQREANDIVAEIRSLGSDENRAGMAKFGINTARAFGVSMTTLKPLARRLKRRHDLAQALWATGWHEARILAALIDEPAKVSERQMDGWVADVDSWDLCDQASMKLFAKTPFVHAAVARWAADEREFVRRAAFATIAGYAIGAKNVPDDQLVPFFTLIERHANDDRNFVKKAVNWALRQVGKRSAALHAPALALARRLEASPLRAARWIGRDAAKELSDPAQLARLARRS